MSKVVCPKCKYEDAEKTITYDSILGSTKTKTITWFCPKCEYEKEKEIEISRAQYRKETGKTEVAKAAAGRTSCCLVGLVPTSLLFLPFMTVYPNEKALLSVIDFHRERTSPVLNKLHFKCGFTPSCSKYSKMAIKKYGTVKGGLKSLWRIIRCNPFNNNKGYDYP